ncbi:MAG TPA: hypothetical protein VM073_00100, partial [Usitatibacter sp.]|nr:hypothetical protein [Usitatibacter sp.]
MDDVGARGDDRANLFAEAREIRGKNARGDAETGAVHGVGNATIFEMPEAKKYSVAVTAHSTYLPDQSDEE